MYDEETDLTVQTRSNDLIEELGEVSFIFTDKTGTLTSNNLIFKGCTINYKTYINEHYSKDQSYQGFYNEVLYKFVHKTIIGHEALLVH